MARPVEGAALLVAAPGADDASTVHALGQIGEALLAAGGGWKVRRLVASDRATLKRRLDELAVEHVRAGVVVIAGEIESDAVITGENHREYPEDTTLKLDWICARLRGAKAEQLVVVVAGRGDGVNVDALATGRAGDVVATGGANLV